MTVFSHSVPQRPNLRSLINWKINKINNAVNEILINFVEVCIIMIRINILSLSEYSCKRKYVSIYMCMRGII